ncbi:unnamed protein product [Rhodiola kirilowii]
MEFNNADASQAFQIALHKLHEGDFYGAKRYVLEVQRLFPELERIPLLLEVIDLHIAAATSVYGERDWYGILRVDPSASREVIKKSFTKLQLKVHPDKNKWPLATEASCLVNEAWDVLGKEESRAEYELTRKGKKISEDPPFADASTSTQGPSAGFPFYDFFNTHAAEPTTPSAPPSPRPAPKPQTPPGTSESVPRPQAPQGTSPSDPNAEARQGTSRSNPKPQARKGTSRRTPKPKASSAKPDTFWTVCSHCKMRYEFESIYINAKLMCPATECNKLFSAVKITPPRRKYKRKQSATPKTTKSGLGKSTASQDVPGSSSTFKSPQVPFFPSTSQDVPGSSSAFRSPPQEPIFSTTFAGAAASPFHFPWMQHSFSTTSTSAPGPSTSRASPGKSSPKSSKRAREEAGSHLQNDHGEKESTKESLREKGTVLFGTFLFETDET